MIALPGLEPGPPAATDDQFGALHDHPPFVGKPRVYVVASIPRTGSHFLCDLLRQCCDLGSPFEYLNKGRRQQWLDSASAENPGQMLNLLAQRRTSPSGWFGCKTHWRDFEDGLTDPGVAAFLANPHYIHIRRRDRLAQAISYVIAGQTKSWRSFQPPMREAVYDRTAIDGALAEIAWQENCWREFFTAQKIEPLTIDYEALDVCPRQCIDAIRHYLDMPRRDIGPSSTVVKRQAIKRNDEWRTLYETGL